MLAAVLAAVSVAIASASIQSAANAASGPCSSAEHRQFDFWIGDWNVKDTATGSPAGHNLITLEQGSCVLQEHWRGSDGLTGTSFNIYYAGDKKWHQTWVDSSGLLLRLDGGLVDGKMVLSGNRVNRAGKVVTDRIVWTPEPSGDVRQVWDYTTDDGKTWQNVFDGMYVRIH
ncbi:MAG TPA: hypothetical protein VEV38_08605 [Candidatus Eremiobacteraceae bacterium]|nr:hypothetical protein [Candidatus Eremiobacteraceae bacterium]